MFEGWWSNDAEYVELQTVDGYEGDGVAMHKEAKSSIDSVKRRYTMLIFWTTSTATLVSFATWLVVTLSAPYATTKVCTALLRFDDGILGEAARSSWIGYDSLYHPNGGQISPYRGVPNSQIEEHWNNLSQSNGPVILTATEVDQARVKLPDEALLRWSYSANGEVGISTYLAGHYQMSCLNLIRQFTYVQDEQNGYIDLHGIYQNHKLLNETKAAETLDIAGTAREKVDHCIEILRQRITCSGDITPIPLWHNNGSQSIKDDLDGKHFCRSWTAIQEWAAKRKDIGNHAPTTADVI